MQWANPCIRIVAMKPTMIWVSSMSTSKKGMEDAHKVLIVFEAS